jgi:hypothetical protein
MYDMNMAHFSYTQCLGAPNASEALMVVKGYHRG